jgi:predicted phosphodiesterase
MKTLLLADIHIRNPIPFIEKKLNEGIERVISLGDIDDPKILNDFLSLKYQKIALMGNHEYPFIHSFKTGMLHKSIDLIDIPDNALLDRYSKWHSYPLIKKYALKCMENIWGNEEGFSLTEDLDGLKIFYTHGLICPDSWGINLPGRIWASLNTLERGMNNNLVNQNLREMQKRNLDIFFRGHDHTRDIQSLGKKENPYVSPVWQHNLSTQANGQITLSNDRRYLITIGAFTWGDYMIFDSKTKELEWNSF